MGEGNSQNQLTEDQFEEWKSTLWSNIATFYEKSNPNPGKKLIKKAQPVAKMASTGLKSPEELPLKIVYIEQ